MSLATRLEAHWWNRRATPLAELALWPLSIASLGFRAGFALDRARTRPLHAAVPVISVGNLCVGGSGKTPVALFVCQRLLARGLRPALLSRGHGRESSAALEVQLDSTVVDTGDEPLLLKRRCPTLAVWVGRDRAALSLRAVERGADVLVLDDGLQHHRLSRDLDVVVIDASNPLGNGRLLPRGPLREDLGALARIGARGLLWLTRMDRAEPADATLAAVIQRSARSGLVGPIESEVFVPSPEGMNGKRVFVLAAIARPDRFFDTLRSLGAEIVGASIHPDHHAFSVELLRTVQQQAMQARAECVALTEKDFVRLAPGDTSPLDLPLVQVPIELRVRKNLDALDAALDRACSRAAP